MSMGLPLRRFVVGLAALAVLLYVFALYTGFGRTPPILTSARELPPEPADEADAADLPGEVGTIMGVGVDRVERTQFFHTDENGRVDREFGFERLLHEKGNWWEIAHPYMRLFLSKLRCDVMADLGKVQVDAATRRPMPKDATFSGNVVIHVIPVDPNDPWECFIHLDHVGFLVEKSLFSTSGPVRFLSRSARLTGSGMELIYDQARSRLELLRIFDLESLRLRSSEFGAVADIASQPSNSGGPEVASATRSQKGESRTEAAAEGYRCVLRGNVTIETPDRTVVARNLLSINNIFWSPSKNPDEEGTESTASQPVPFADSNALDTSVSSHLALDSVPDHLFDIAVTCDRGFVIAPKGSPTAFSEPASSLVVASARKAAGQSASLEGPEGPGARDERPVAIPPHRQHVAAQRIDFDYATTNTTLAGPVEMTFHVDPNGLTGAPAGAKPMPMTVTAQEAVRFLAESNQIVLKGGCEVALHRSEPNLSHEYALTAPRFTLDLIKDPNTTNQVAASVRRFLADGGPVELRIQRRDPNRLLGWIRLNASQLQYQADPREFTAFGPGTLTIHNAVAMDPKADPNQLGLGRPCYAFLSNFDVLTYSAAASRIVAEARSQQLLLDYFPLDEGQYDRAVSTAGERDGGARHIQVVTGHVEASLKEAADGRMELASLTASKGIDFEDEESHFVGSDLFYDHAQGLVTVKGNSTQSCYLNGALVDEIEMNVRTGDLRFEPVAPSILQIPR